MKVKGRTEMASILKGKEQLQALFDKVSMPKQLQDYLVVVDLPKRMQTSTMISKIKTS